MQTINVGTGANTHDGDTLRAAMQKVDANFKELVLPIVDLTEKVFPVRSFGAFPDTGANSLPAIQAAIEAASAVGGTVVLEAGTYNLDPDTIVYPARTSETHPSCLTIWANNVKIVGAGGWATTLRLTKTVAGGGIVNMLGSGSAVGAGDASDTTFSGVRLAGFNLDANSFRAECTQIYNAVDWVLSDIGVRNTIAGCDGFDTQGGNGIRCYNLFAIDVQENAFGTQDTNLFVDGFTVIRCGKTGGTGSAFQFNIGLPLFKNVVATDCPFLLAPGSNCYFVDSHLGSSNATAAHNCFTFGAGTVGIFRNVVVTTPTVADGAIFSISGGAVEANQLMVQNYKPIFNMSSGFLTLMNSYLGGNGSARPIVTAGGTILRVINNRISGNTAQRDIRLEPGTYTTVQITGNSFLGAVGVALDSSATAGIVVDNNYIISDCYFSLGAGSRVKNNTIKGAFIAAGGAYTLDGNLIGGVYTRNGGTITFVNSNVFLTASNTTEVQESNPAFNSITPTTTTTSYTNNNPFPVTVYFRGGTIDSVSKNGTQVYGVSTAGNSLVLAFGETIAISNSVTAGMVVNWLQNR